MAILHAIPRVYPIVGLIIFFFHFGMFEIQKLHSSELFIFLKLFSLTCFLFQTINLVFSTFHM